MHWRRWYTLSSGQLVTWIYAGKYKSNCFHPEVLLSRRQTQRHVPTFFCNFPLLQITEPTAKCFHLVVRVILSHLMYHNATCNHLTRICLKFPNSGRPMEVGPFPLLVRCCGTIFLITWEQWTLSSLSNPSSKFFCSNVLISVVHKWHHPDFPVSFLFLFVQVPRNRTLDWWCFTSVVYYYYPQYIGQLWYLIDV